MSDGTDIGKGLDPGPELPSYDPAWEVRWNAADTLLRLLRERDPGGASELSGLLIAELCQALESSFRFACDLEAHLAAQSAGPAERARIPLPLIAASARPEEIVARHNAFRTLCARVIAYRAAEPFEDWDTGVFRLDPPDGAAREIHDREVPADWCSERLAKARLIIERHGRDIHVCVLEHPRSEPRMSLATVRMMAGSLAEEFLLDRREWRARFRREPRPRLMVYEIFTQPGSLGATARIPELEVICNRSGQIRLVETGIRRRATPLIVREMLNMDAELRVALRR